MRKLIKNRKAVSEIISYALSLGIMTIILVSTYFMINHTLDEKVKITGNIQAGNIADEIANAVLNTITMRQLYPYSDYSRTITIPWSIANKDYYIEITNSFVYVNSTDGVISERSSLFRVPIVNNIDVRNKVYGSAGRIKITSPKTEYIHRFDFGPANSTSPWDREQGYTRISNFTKNDLDGTSPGNWWNDNSDWDYCRRIVITNPTDEELNDFPILVRLNPSNFDYSKANNNGSDIRFLSENNDEPLPYWIERWNPWNTSTSRIWVNVPVISEDGTYIYMFYGNKTANSLSNGKNVFPFFEDFSNSDISDSYYTNNWTFNNYCSIEDNMLVLKSGGENGPDAIATVTKTNIRNGTIEAKVRATGDTKDIGIFARENDTAGDWSYIFHNGKRSKNIIDNDTYNFNCSISKNSTLFGNPLGQWPRALSKERIPIDISWNRLVFHLNGNDYVGARYKYDNYEINAFANWTNTDDDFLNHCHDGSFGLINMYGETSYVDFIFLRPFAGNIYLSPEDNPEPKDAYPYAFVGGTISEYFHWDDTSNLITGIHFVSNDLSRDFVGSNSERVFTIKNLEVDETYSVVYIIGDKKESIENMTITVNTLNTIEIKDLDPGNYIRDFFTVELDPTSTQIEFKFDANGGYWNICSLTVEKKERKIILEAIF